MSWDKIKAYSSETLELKRVSSYILNELTYSGTTVYTYHDSIFQLKFYNFMKMMRKKYKISPNEILCFLVKNPVYIDKIYKQDLITLQSLLIQSTKNEEYRIISFVTLYYDNFNRYNSIFKALLKTVRYPFDKFDLKFVKHVFNLYPFLSDKKHLDHVIDKIKEKKYAYYLTVNGIKEKYE